MKVDTHNTSPWYRSSIIQLIDDNTGVIVEVASFVFTSVTIGDLSTVG